LTETDADAPVPPAVEAYGLNFFWRVFAEHHHGDLATFCRLVDGLAVRLADFALSEHPRPALPDMAGPKTWNEWLAQFEAKS
jgi:hypothetical protein